MRQFMSIVLTTIGGVLGAFAGFVAAAIVSEILRPPTLTGPIGSSVVVTILAASVLGGIVTGILVGRKLASVCVLGSTRTRSKLTNASEWTIAVLIVFAGLFEFVGCLPTARNTAARVRCEKALEELYPILGDYLRAHHTLPIGTEGSTSLSMLLSESAGNDSPRPCCGVDFDACYAVSPTADSAIVSAGNSRLPQIVVYDRPGNHIQRLGNGLAERKNGVVQEQASLLLSNGQVVHWWGDSPIYAEWAKQFADSGGPSYPPGIREKVSEDFAIWRSRTTHTEVDDP